MSEIQGRDPLREGIPRSRLPAVIRRAAELHAVESESSERLSTEEVLRIAEELGLPERATRQALFELPAEAGPERLADRLVGPPLLTVQRAVPGAAEEVLSRLERYLVKQEYLEVRRRRGQTLLLQPADDTWSSVVRTFRRSGSRHYVARSPSVRVRAQPLDAAAAHLCLELDLSDRRRGAAAGGLALGGITGTVLGGGALAAGVALAGGVADPVALTLAGGAGLAGMAGGVVMGVRFAAATFRARIGAARTELEGLLDRIERGDRLEAPPSPVRRWLQAGVSTQR